MNSSGNFKSWSITVMCDALKVSRSGFYAWLKRKAAPPTSRELEKQKRRDLVEDIFNGSRNPAVEPYLFIY